MFQLKKGLTQEESYPLVQREPITIDFWNTDEDLVISDVYETRHHGPVITFNESENLVYAIRGCWDRSPDSLNIVREGYGLLTAANIESAVDVMNSTKCLPTGNILFVNAAGDPNGTGDRLMQYMLKGPLPDRRNCTSFELKKYDYTEWVDGCIDGWDKGGTDDIFDTLYDYSELPQDYYQPGTVEYFINCNCSVNYNNLNSTALNLETLLFEHGASLVYQDHRTYRQRRAQNLKDLASFSVSYSYLKDNFLLEKCHNLGAEVVTDLSYVYETHIDSMVPPTYPADAQEKLGYAMTELLNWRNGVDGDITEIEDNAPSDHDSTGMYLFKLWQSHFMYVTCGNEVDTWTPFFEIPIHRAYLDEQPAEFCRSTLMDLYEAYEKWYGAPEKQWGKHCSIQRHGPSGIVYKETDGDSNCLRSNVPNGNAWIQNLWSVYDTMVVGNGQSSPTLIKMDPIDLKIYYSRAVDSCCNPTMYSVDWLDPVADNGDTIFDTTYRSTENWVNNHFEIMDIDP